MIYIVLPTYNEEINIKPLLESIKYSMEIFGYDYKVLVINDGSTDDTERVVKSLAQSLPLDLITHKENKGLGVTLKNGIYHSLDNCDDKDIIITMDADNTHIPGLILRMVRNIWEGSDIVIASRYKPDARIKGLSLSRRMLSKGGSIMLQVLFPIKGVKDYTSGYRAYRVDCLKKGIKKYGDEFINQPGFSCVVDVLLKLRKLDPIINEVPLILRYDAKVGASKMKVFENIRTTLLLMLKTFLKRQSS